MIVIKEFNLNTGMRDVKIGNIQIRVKFLSKKVLIKIHKTAKVNLMADHLKIV
jgi:hypothetical protein